MEMVVVIRHRGATVAGLDVSLLGGEYMFYRATSSTLFFSILGARAVLCSSMESLVVAVELTGTYISIRVVRLHSLRKCGAV